MAKITAEYRDVLMTNKLVEKGDFTALVKLTREAGFKKGMGYCRQTIKKFVLDEAETTPEMVSLIRKFYESKVESISELKAMADTINSKLQNS